MSKFRKKPVVIEAITFEEFVQYGKDNGGNIVSGMPWSFYYKGQPVSHENDECYLIPTKEGTMNFTPADMLITGVQGEICPCKKDIFEATYDKVEDEKQQLSFGQAIEALKQGKKVARTGWNGLGMFLYLVPGSVFKVNREPLLSIYEEGTEITYRPHIDLKTADGSIATWSPSGSDALAEDWIIL
jgi:hypothetical protein